MFSKIKYDISQSTMFTWTESLESFIFQILHFIPFQMLLLAFLRKQNNHRVCQRRHRILSLFLLPESNPVLETKQEFTFKLGQSTRTLKPSHSSENDYVTWNLKTSHSLENNHSMRHRVTGTGHECLSRRDSISTFTEWLFQWVKT